MPRKHENHIIQDEVESFMIDRRARQLSRRTLEFYRDQLGIFMGELEKAGVQYIEDMDARAIRQVLADYGEGHNNGGVHCLYRAVKAFCMWYERDTDSAWANPIRKVDAPKNHIDPIPGVTLEQVRCMTEACQGRGWLGRRDYALLLFLFDTGVRRNECLALRLQDVDLETGTVQVYNGKGNKDRVVYIGDQTILAVRKYLRGKRDRPGDSLLWVTEGSTRLTQGGFRQILRRRSADCGYKEISAHDYRRGFALNMLRNGADLLSVSKLLGHSSLEVTKRYLALTDEDLERVHHTASPADRLRSKKRVVK